MIMVNSRRATEIRKCLHGLCGRLEGVDHIHDGLPETILQQCMLKMRLMYNSLGVNEKQV